MLSPFPMNYAESIRLLRLKAKMSQGDLARRIGGGITNQSVSGWERGRAKPSRENLLELAKIFNVSAGEIMSETGQGDVPRTADEPPSLLFVAVEETLLLCSVNAAAAAEISEVVELAVENLRVPQGMTPESALRRIIRWEVPEILTRER